MAASPSEGEIRRYIVVVLLVIFLVQLNRMTPSPLGFANGGESCRLKYRYEALPMGAIELDPLGEVEMESLGEVEMESYPLGEVEMESLGEVEMESYTLGEVKMEPVLGQEGRPALVFGEAALDSSASVLVRERRGEPRGWYLQSHRSRWGLGNGWKRPRGSHLQSHRGRGLGNGWKHRCLKGKCGMRRDRNIRYRHVGGGEETDDRRAAGVKRYTETPFSSGELLTLGGMVEGCVRGVERVKVGETKDWAQIDPNVRSNGSSTIGLSRDILGSFRLRTERHDLNLALHGFNSNSTTQAQSSPIGLENDHPNLPTTEHASPPARLDRTWQEWCRVIPGPFFVSLLALVLNPSQNALLRAENIRQYLRNSELTLLGRCTNVCRAAISLSELQNELENRRAWSERVDTLLLPPPPSPPASLQYQRPALSFLGLIQSFLRRSDGRGWVEVFGPELGVSRMVGVGETYWCNFHPTFFAFELTVATFNPVNSAQSYITLAYSGACFQDRIYAPLGNSKDRICGVPPNTSLVAAGLPKRNG
ncbi:hypothetical protein DFP72DRAFT_846019 [Ephemerocybe angulata]|uniref:Uncharacterized protein n=1 Tax=Ephemerocybe angulata TaxID=980116 RepID=A0A8H6I1D0_9AGAR|nr:hypothetical protein DFP72DRAFT_846019 [Tulosesus angulatus]